MRSLFKLNKILILGLTGISSTIIGFNMTYTPPIYNKSKNKNVQQMVYMCGNKTSIPQHIEQDLSYPTAISWFSDTDLNWSKINFGPNFGVAVADSGQLFFWGLSDNETICCEPIDLTPSNKKIIDAQCSSSSIFTLDNKGEVLIWSFSSEIFNLLSKNKTFLSKDNPNKNQFTRDLSKYFTIKKLYNPGWFSNTSIVQMDVGANHTAFVSNKGELYCYGNNDFGQCGYPPLEIISNSENNNSVNKVDFTEKVFIVKAVCGSKHTLALDKDGNVYSFGDDSKIQLLLGDTRSPYGEEPDKSVFNFSSKYKSLTPNKSNIIYGFHERHLQYHPQKISTQSTILLQKFGTNFKASDIFAGNEFSIIKFTDINNNSYPHSILMCGGENQYGQCGRGLNKQQQTLATMKLPSMESVDLTSCGSNHCLSYTNLRNLYSWGFNSNGQTGHGGSKLISSPIKIKLNPTKPSQELSETASNENPQRIIYLSCGFNNSAIIVEKSI